ncbi:MAG: peptidoglycan-binding domain-containing protein, partial [Syntrophomonas sp.]|nr:peptidoglycan-binding domain-containing protein [Syntrophomonas sp.]
MKKEYYLFFILILAAAMVAGSTLGITMNYKYISEQVINQRSQQETLQAHPEQQSHSPLEVKIPPEDMPPAIPSKPNNDSASQSNNITDDTSASVTVSSSSGGNRILLLSQAEKSDIEIMLTATGIAANDNYSQRIREFQENNSLSATGIMDSQTLSLLIRKTTLQQ